MEHKPGPKKDGKPWVNRSTGEEWQRWWCGQDHRGDGHKCSVSIPQKTGRTVKQ